MVAQKPLKFTKHAEDAILERKVLRDWIAKTVQEPQWSYPDPHQIGAKRHFRSIPENGGRILRVVCLETADELRILTIFFDRNARAPK